VSETTQTRDAGMFVSDAGLLHDTRTY